MSINKLRVYALSETLSDRVSEIVKQWPEFHIKTLGSQLVRAADSVSNNITEGYARMATGERLHFYMYALGSLQETRNCIRRAAGRELLDQNVKSEIERLCYHINRALVKLAYVQMTSDETYKGPFRETLTSRWRRLNNRHDDE